MFHFSPSRRRKTRWKERDVIFEYFRFRLSLSHSLSLSLSLFLLPLVVVSAWSVTRCTVARTRSSAAFPLGESHTHGETRAGNSSSLDSDRVPSTARWKTRSGKTRPMEERSTEPNQHFCRRDESRNDEERGRKTIFSSSSSSSRRQREERRVGIVDHGIRKLRLRSTTDKSQRRTCSRVWSRASYPTGRILASGPSFRSPLSLSPRGPWTADAWCVRAYVRTPRGCLVDVWERTAAARDEPGTRTPSRVVRWIETLLAGSRRACDEESSGERDEARKNETDWCACARVTRSTPTTRSNTACPWILRTPSVCVCVCARQLYTNVSACVCVCARASVHSIV